MGISTRIGTRIRTRVRGGHATPDSVDLPASLAEAIVLRYVADAELATLCSEVYQAEAGVKAVLPYVVFTVRSSPTIRLTSSSLWKDALLRFEAFAATVEAADAIVQAISHRFKGTTLDWRTGSAIPLVPKDRSQASAKRTRDNSRVFRGLIEFSARYREER